MDTGTQFAQWLGSNALAVFGSVLALLLVSVAMCWSALPGHGTGGNSWFIQLGAGRRALSIVAVAIVLVAGLVFACATTALAPASALGRFDVALAQTLASQSLPATLQGFAVLTHLGDGATLSVLCIVVAVVLWVSGHRGLALAWVLAVAGNGVVNNAFKRHFERGRPGHAHPLLVTYHGWSFPSGHSSGAVVAYGMLAVIAVRLAAPRWKLPLLLLCSAAAFGTGASRIFLQVHYASDVVAGMASGAMWLALCLLGMEWVRQRQPLAP